MKNNTNTLPDIAIKEAVKIIKDYKNQYIKDQIKIIKK